MKKMGWKKISTRIIRAIAVGIGYILNASIYFISLVVEERKERKVKKVKGKKGKKKEETMIKKVLWVIGKIAGIACIIFLLVYGLSHLISFYQGYQWEDGVKGILIVAWLLLSIKFLGPDEMAVLVIFGYPVEFHDSGPCFVPFLPYCYLARRPKTLYNFDYPASEVITKEGVYSGTEERTGKRPKKGPKKEIKKGTREEPKKGTKYATQVITVDSVAYLRFPASKRLIDIVKSRIPVKTEELKDWTEESVVGALRVVLGRKTWKEITEEIDKVRRKAQGEFRRRDGALLMAGFDPKDMRLTIKEIKLPKELEAALPIPDRERLKEEAAGFVARRQAIEWVGMVLEAYALAKGKSLKEIQKEIETDEKMQREFLDYSKKMNLRLEEADRQALHHVIVEGDEKSNEGKGEGFIDTLAKAAIKVIIASKMFPEEKGGKGKPSPGEKEKKVEEMTGGEILRHLEREEFGSERS